MYRSIIPAAIFIILVSTGCNTARFEKMESGLEYKIIKGKGDKEIKPGNFVSMTITQYYNDSLMATPFDTIPQVIQVDSMRIPGEYVRIFLKAKTGDSIVTKISTDSVANHGPLPPYAKEHQYFGTRFKVVDVYASQEEAMKAQEALRSRMMRADSLSMEKQKVIDETTIKDYLDKKKIKAVRTPEGTYVEVINEGTGAPVEKGKAASVLYKGMLLDGVTVFDQSYDSTGNPTQPFTFVVGQPGAIEGWSDGMVYFKEGGEGRLYIPSGRAYGSRGSGKIPPNTPIMFDVKITKVMSDADYQKSLDEQRKRVDSLQKAQMEKMKKDQEEKKPDEKK